jgi:hypothetical protein
VQKAESTQKAEIKKAAAIYEQKIQARTRDM